MARRPSSSNNKLHGSWNLIKSVVKGWRRVESTDTRWRARGIIVITSASRSNLLVRHDICSLPSPDGRHNAVDLLSFTRPGLTRNPRHPLRHDARNHCAPGRKTTPTINSVKKEDSLSELLDCSIITANVVIVVRSAGRALRAINWSVIPVAGTRTIWKISCFIHRCRDC